MTQPTVPQTQAVQQAAPKPLSLAQQTSGYVSKMTAEWAKVLPTVCTPERFARVVLSCLNGNPKLAQALTTPRGKISLSQAFMKCAEVGLEPNGRDAHLIPYKDDIQLILDYKGIVKLCRRSGEIANIIAEAVHEKDEFSYEDGIVHHKIDFRLADRGPTYAWYVKVVFKDGTVQSKVMGKADVEAIRKRSRAKDSGPWVTDYDAMALKSTFKQLSKWLPMAYEPLERAIQYDNEEEREIIDLTQQRPSRFDAAQQPSGGFLSALSGQHTEEEPAVEAQVVEQPAEQPAEQTEQKGKAAKQATDKEIEEALMAANAPVSVAELKEWYAAENGEWNPAFVMAHLDGCISKALDFRDNR